ncbi:ABC transporter permease [Luteococcus sp. OSA5]|uniref:ABC transporter permease n=1 Tax=Luteococcus sp. OSA5 TaxID=3401630 RepID=UPI003B4339DB
MNATYIRIDLLRQLRSIPTIAFTFAMPSFMYVLFGANTPYGDSMAGHANNKFYVMTSMAAYGAATAAVSIASMAATESMLGWGRQLALTRASTAQVAANKVAVATVVAMVAQGLVFGVGWSSGARADGWQVWLWTFVISLAGAALFAAYGMGVGLLFKSETAVGLASSSLVFLAFLGNVFTPLDGFMLKLAHITPMYGYIGLVRWPQLEGSLLQTGPEDPGSDALWVLLANLGAWTLVFVALALLGLRRARARQ